MKKIQHSLEIVPAIPIEDRHKLEDALREMGYDVFDSGMWLDMTACNIEFEKKTVKSKKKK